jgi:glutaconate CoA-transferase subunit A
VLHDNKPVALERALLRSGCRNLRYIGLSGSGYDLDLLVARGGVIGEIFVPVVTFDDIGFAPAYRWAVEERTVTAHMVDVATVMAGYFAGASGVPFHPATAIRGSDVTRHNPLVSEVTWRDGESIPVVAAINPDVALIHAQEADRRGNAMVYGSTAEAERMIARAAKRVIISCDRLVPTSHFERDPMATTIPGMYVDAVCHLPFGAHPTGSPREYGPDAAFLREYWKSVEDARRAKDRAPVTKHLERFVDACRTHADYLALIGGATLARLCMGDGDGR